MSPEPCFADLGLTPALSDAAAAAGWSTPTAVQVAVLPAVLQGRDLLAESPTGSGKTAAFVLPLLQRLLAVPALASERPRRLRALVLAPTRELALQTGDAVRGLVAGMARPPRCVVAVGGASINPQMMALRGGAHLLVATPGRLLDLLAHNALTLAEVELLVLDEADRLLDLGFADELGRVLAALPARRQTLLFSATLPAAVQALAGQALRDPLQVTAPTSAAAALPDIAQRAIVVDSSRRTALLRQLIAEQGWPRLLVFVATQYASEHVADKLRRGGLTAQALHGKLSPGRRQQVLADFQAGRLTVLVATDLAARGIDVPGLGVVLNHDLPRSAVDHLHRIGRTGRAGEAGLALSFICADQAGSEAHFRMIEKRQQQRVPREQLAGFEPAAPTPADGPGPEALGGIKGHRKSKKDKLREAAAAAPGAAGQATAMSGEALGRWLVALQLALMALIAWLAAPVFLRGDAPPLAWALLVVSVVLGLWALSANRPGNFNIRPTPKPGAALVRGGPYRWIRHPMYSAVLVAALAGLLGTAGAARPAVGAAALALLAVLWFKAGLEERWMAQRHPAYADYRRRTRRFLPWLL